MSAFNVFIGGGAGGGAEGEVAPPPLADKGVGKRYQCPPPFRRFSGMMPASTEKHMHIQVKMCEKLPKMRKICL